MKNHGRSDLTVLDYPGAGHGLGVIVPNIPTSPTLKSRYGVLDLGGSPLGDANARADSWPKLLRFLSRLLTPSTPGKALSTGTRLSTHLPVDAGEHPGQSVATSPGPVLLLCQ